VTAGGAENRTDSPRTQARIEEILAASQ